MSLSFLRREIRVGALLIRFRILHGVLIRGTARQRTEQTDYIVVPRHRAKRSAWLVRGPANFLEAHLGMVAVI
jgi:hypothetical protein